MLTRDNNKLAIFEDFIVDRKLLKYTTTNTESLLTSHITFIEFDSGSIDNSVRWGTSNLGIESGAPINNTSKHRIINWLVRGLSSVTSKRKLTVQEFFDEIKSMLTINSNSFSAEDYDERVRAYTKALDNAVRAGQTALQESIMEQLDIFKLESILYGANNVVTITEDQVIQFYMESETGLRLDWIKNFNRVIPQSIVNKKVKIDELQVFDNYVIMHYDPNIKAFKKTKADIEKEKDPILFGLIKNSNKLYYIADWVDEYCDLTLDKFIETYGEEAINKNNITAKFI